MLSDYAYFSDLTRPDPLHFTALEGPGGVLPPEMLDAIQRAAELLEGSSLHLFDASGSGTAIRS